MDNIKWPRWDTAPAWANYRAADADGAVYWYEYQPEGQTTYWEATLGLVAYAGDVKLNGTIWNYTCEFRPQVPA